MVANIAYWCGFLFGRFVAVMLTLSLILVVVRNQTRKNIIIAAFVGCVITTLISIAGDVNGRLLTPNLFKYLLLVEAIPLVAVFVIATFLIIWRKWNTQKWFAKGLPWVGGVLYGLILCLLLPQEIKKQYEIQKIAQEMTFRQFNELPNSIKSEVAYKILGINDAAVFNCVKASQESANVQDVKFKEIMDICRDIAYGVPEK